jgi:hypothetical protein
MSPSTAAAIVRTGGRPTVQRVERRKAQAVEQYAVAMPDPRHLTHQPIDDLVVAVGVVDARPLLTFSPGWDLVDCVIG